MCELERKIGQKMLTRSGCQTITSNYFVVDAFCRSPEKFVYHSLLLLPFDASQKLKSSI